MSKIYEYSGIYYPTDSEFRTMKKKAAKEYFEYFVKNIHSRILYLNDKSNLNLNFTAESLIDTWRWYLDNTTFFENDPIIVSNLKKELKDSKLPDIVKLKIIGDNKYVLSDESRAMAVDIGIYVGELCMKLNHCLSWDIIYSKNYLSGNRPIIYGFTDHEIEIKNIFEQDIIGASLILAGRVMNNSAKIDDLYCVFKNKLEKNFPFDNISATPNRINCCEIRSDGVK